MIDPEVVTDLTELKAWELDRILNQMDEAIARSNRHNGKEDGHTLFLSTVKGRVLAEFARRRPNSHVRT